MSGAYGNEPGHKVGDRANGHILTAEEGWVPLPPPSRTNRWVNRIVLGAVLLVVAAGVVVGITSNLKPHASGLSTTVPAITSEEMETARLSNRINEVSGYVKQVWDAATPAQQASACAEWHKDRIAYMNLADSDFMYGMREDHHREATREERALVWVAGYWEMVSDCK